MFFILKTKESIGDGVVEVYFAFHALEDCGLFDAPLERSGEHGCQVGEYGQEDRSHEVFPVVVGHVWGYWCCFYTLCLACLVYLYFMVCYYNIIRCN